MLFLANLDGGLVLVVVVVVVVLVVLVVLSIEDRGLCMADLDLVRRLLVVVEIESSLDI